MPWPQLVPVSRCPCPCAHDQLVATRSTRPASTSPCSPTSSGGHASPLAPPRPTAPAGAGAAAGAAAGGGAAPRPARAAAAAAAAATPAAAAAAAAAAFALRSARSSAARCAPGQG